MKNKIQKILLIAGVFASGVVHAFPQWSGDVTIDHLRMHGSGWIYGAVVSGSSPCASTALVIPSTTSTAIQNRNDKTFSILLTSVAMGASVRLYIDGCSSSGLMEVSGARIINP